MNIRKLSLKQAVSTCSIHACHVIEFAFTEVYYNWHTCILLFTKPSLENWLKFVCTVPVSIKCIVKWEAYKRQRFVLWPTNLTLTLHGRFLLSFICLTMIHSVTFFCFYASVWLTSRTFIDLQYTSYLATDNFRVVIKLYLPFCFTQTSGSCCVQCSLL